LKKPSAASSTPKLLDNIVSPDDLILFIDRSLGRHVIADALRRAGAHVEIHDEQFAQNATDEEWLQEAGRRRWAVLTKDARIRYRSPALRAIRKGHTAVFVLTRKGSATASEMAEIFRRALPAIARAMACERPPFIAKVLSSGKVELTWPGRRGRKPPPHR
jgi:predicted nuclease of predicted toxin-antitoxin system